MLMKVYINVINNCIQLRKWCLKCVYVVVFGVPQMVDLCIVEFHWTPKTKRDYFGTMRKSTILEPGSEVPGRPLGPPKWSLSFWEVCKRLTMHKYNIGSKIVDFIGPNTVELYTIGNSEIDHDPNRQFWDPQIPILPVKKYIFNCLSGFLLVVKSKRPPCL